MLEEHWEALVSLTSNWHPKSNADRRPMRITAPMAEAARLDVIRDLEEDSPLQKLTAAKAAGDRRTIETIFNQVWFGMPESTECWSVPGFKIMCNLLDGSYD